MAGEQALSTQEIQAALNGFVEPKHMAVETLQEYQQAVQLNPLRIVHIRAFLQPNIVDTVSRFLHESSLYGDICGRYSSPKPAPLSENWQAVPDDDRFFRYQMLNGTSTQSALSQDALTFLKLRQLLSSAAFKSYVQYIFNDKLGEIEAFRVHRMLPQHFLRPHNDRGRQRKLAIILYLSPNWHTGYGGQLQLQEQGGGTQVFEPVHNSLLVFDVASHKQHWVDPVIWPHEHCGFARVSMSSWFRHPEHHQ